MVISSPMQRAVANAPGEPSGVGAAPAATPETAAAPAATAPTPDPAPAPAAEVAAPDLSWLPEGYKTEAGYDVDRFRTDYEDMLAAQAVLSEQGPVAPESPDAYDLSVPEDLDFGDIKAPDGFEFAIDPENPLVGQLKEFMHQHKMPAEAAKGMVQMLARYEASKASEFVQHREQQMQALGPQGTARLGRIQRTLETRLSNPAQRTALLQSITSADAVRGLEALIGGASAVQPPSAPASSASLAGLSGYEKLKAARGG